MNKRLYDRISTWLSPLSFWFLPIFSVWCCDEASPVWTKNYPRFFLLQFWLAAYEPLCPALCNYKDSLIFSGLLNQNQQSSRLEGLIQCFYSFWVKYKWKTALMGAGFTVWLNEIYIWTMSKLCVCFSAYPYCCRNQKLGHRKQFEFGTDTPQYHWIL